MKSSALALLDDLSSTRETRLPAPRGAELLLSPAARAALGEIGSLYDKSLSDLLNEAINMTLAHYGHPAMTVDAVQRLDGRTSP